MMNKIVTICGSMKFQKQMLEAAERLELENGYSGQSTKSEIEYARSLNKEVIFLEPTGSC